VVSESKNAWKDRRAGYRLKLNGAMENAVAHTKSLRAYSFRCALISALGTRPPLICCFAVRITATAVRSVLVRV
jgi:hypothetical protein